MKRKESVMKVLEGFKISGKFLSVAAERDSQKKRRGPGKWDKGGEMSMHIVQDEAKSEEM